MNANYGVPLRAMFPNAQIIIDRFHIIQLAMKAVQSPHVSHYNEQLIINV